LAGTLLDAYDAYDLGKTDPKIEDLRAIGELSGLTVTARCKLHALLGFFCREEGRFDEALVEYNQAIELDGTYAWAIGGRGLAYCLTNKYEEALSDFNRGIELDEKYTFAFEGRGVTYYLMGRYEEALATFNRIVDLAGEEASVFESRGEFYRLVGKYEESLSDFNRAAELDPESPWAVEGRGLTYRLLGKYEEALADYIRATALEPDDFKINLGLIACYRRLGFADNYEGLVSKARELAAEEDDYHRACFMALSGNADEAFILLKSALETGLMPIDWVKRDPDFDWIRDDPRMEALLQEMERGKDTA
jgi:tetratricopeptide (TPR) repeat protein